MPWMRRRSINALALAWYQRMLMLGGSESFVGGGETDTSKMFKDMDRSGARKTKDDESDLDDEVASYRSDSDLMDD